MKSKKSIRSIKIKGQRWTIRLLNDEQYRELSGSLDAQAKTVYNHGKGFREIWIRRKYFNFDTVLHEVLHAYLSYKDYRGYTYAQMEEAFCEFLPKNVYRMLKSSYLILRK